MRAIITAGVLLAGGTSTLAAQQSRDLAVDIFGDYIRFDQAFTLDHGIGGGARFTYFITTRIGLGADVLFSRDLSVPPPG